MWIVINFFACLVLHIKILIVRMKSSIFGICGFWYQTFDVSVIDHLEPILENVNKLDVPGDQKLHIPTPAFLYKILHAFSPYYIIKIYYSLRDRPYDCIDIGVVPVLPTAENKRLFSYLRNAPHNDDYSCCDHAHCTSPCMPLSSLVRLAAKLLKLWYFSPLISVVS